MLFTCCLLLCLLAGSQQLSITEISGPHAVGIGEEATLSCRFEAIGERGVYVKWWQAAIEGSASGTRRLLYQRFAGHAPQPIKQTFNITARENDTISLTGLTPEDSGFFECEVSAFPNEDRKGLILIVYSEGTGPRINVTEIEDDDDDDDPSDDLALIECDAKDVAPVPELAVTLSGKHLNVTQKVSGPEAGLYSVVANIQIRREDVDGAEIRCELFYKDEEISHQPFVDTFVYEQSGGATVVTESLLSNVTNAADLTDVEQPLGNNGSKLKMLSVFLIIMIQILSIRSINSL